MLYIGPKETRDQMDASTIILGFTGSLGSGCTYISQYLPKVSDIPYSHFKLSSIIRNSLKEKEGIDSPSVVQLQDKGNALRKEYGNGFLIGELIKVIEADDNHSKDDIIIDGIKNEGEIKILRQFPFFFLFSVQSSDENRIKRYKEDGIVSEDDEFNEVDNRDKFEDFNYGQQVKRCNYLADIIILNDTKIAKADTDGKYKFVRDIYQKYVKLIENLKNGETPISSIPSVDELCMTNAYAISKMSSCIKRKVGSIIVDTATSKIKDDKRGQILSLPFIVSTGYNEVPLGSQKCIFHPEYQMCYRDFLKQRHARKIKYCPNCGEKINVNMDCPHCLESHDHYVNFCIKCQKEIEDTFKCEKCKSKVFKEFLPGEKETPGKLLDMCRALHAEEQALLNLNQKNKQVKSEEGLTLYVTTQPCNLCANKIVTSGISKVIFDEPYFIKESAEILTSGGVKIERFQGVKSSAYFKLY
jgi:deoxycytidylate deaminase